MEEFLPNNLELPDVCFNLDERFGDFYEDLLIESESEKESFDGESRYKIEDKIASGGLKDIFRVFDLKSSRHVAMAFLREDLDLAVDLSSFIREAQVTALLEHPNIIPVYDVGVEEKPYFTMKLVHGEDLSFYLFKEPNKFSRNEFLRVFLKICDAIAYAHSRGVVHLDLKPENIRIDRYGEVLVHDWGLSKRIFVPEGDKNELEKDAVEVSDYIQGTPSYMAPEQFVPSKVDDERSDIFSLGGLLYSMLTHKPPFSSEIDNKREYVLPSRIDPQIPESLCAVVTKSLDENPDSRYQNVNDVKNDIERYLDGFATSAESASFYKQLNLLVKRNKKTCIAILTSLVIIVALVSVFIVKIKESEANTKRALNQATIAQGKAEEALIESQRNFDLFIKEKENSKEISDVTSGSLSMTDIIPNKFNYGATLNLLKTGLKVSPGNKDLHRKKLLFHLFHEEFKKADKEFEYTDKPEFIASAIKVIRALKLNESNERLTDEEFINLIGHLKEADSNWIAEVLCATRAASTKGLKRQLKLLEELFKVANKRQLQWNFDYETKDGIIFSYFGLKGTKEVHSYCALAGRYISVLDISNAKDLYTNDLSLLYVKKLIAYNVAIRRVEKLKRVKGLEELVVKKGQLTKEEKGKLNFLKVTELE